MVGIRRISPRLHKAFCMALAMMMLFTGTMGFAEASRAEGGYTVKFSLGKGCAVLGAKKEALSQEIQVMHGADLKFQALFNGEEDTTLLVVAGKKELHGKDGLYTVKNITEDVVISVSAVVASENGQEKEITLSKTNVAAQETLEAQQTPEESKEVEVGEEKKSPPIRKEDANDITEEKKVALEKAVPEKAAPEKSGTEEEEALQNKTDALQQEKEPEKEEDKTEKKEEQKEEEQKEEEQKEEEQKEEIEEDTPQKGQGGRPLFRVELPKSDCYTMKPEKGFNPNAVPYKGQFLFSLEAAVGYEGNKPVVSANGMALKGVKQKNTWWYSIVGITCDIKITVNDGEWTYKAPTPTEEIYTITLPLEKGFAVKNFTGGEKGKDNQYTVKEGGEISFEIDVLEGYEKASLVVRANDQLLKADKSGKYTLSDIRSNTTITVELALKSYSHILVFEDGKGYAIKDVKGGTHFGNGRYGINQGETVSFRMDVEPGYDEKNLIVEANGRIITPNKKGVYELVNIREDIKITAVVPAKDNQYIVTLPYGDGYRVMDVRGGEHLGDGRYALRHGQNISFKVRVKDGYDPSGLYVIANGKTLLPDEKGVYTIKDIRKNTYVEIGVGKVVRHLVTFMQSEEFLTREVKGGVQLGEYTYGVGSGNDLSFKVYVKAGNEKNLLVQANGKILQPEKGVYTIKNIREDIKVTFKAEDALIRFSLKDMDTGVRVEGYSKATPRLHVNTVSESRSVYGKLLNKAKNMKALSAYEIKLSGEKAVGDVTVTFPVDKAYNGRKVRILRQRGDGTIAEYSATVKDGRATVTVGALGTFMVAGAKDPGVILPPATGDRDRSYIGWSLILIAEVLWLAVVRRRRYLEEQA